MTTTDPQLVAVALLRARDAEIAALKATIHEKDTTIRWLKQRVNEAEAETARAQELANQSFFDHLD